METPDASDTPFSHQVRGHRMKRLLVTVALGLLLSDAALATNPQCEAQATEKKLAGAAKTSFMKKCEKDATDAAKKSCDAQATEKKLAGAAKNSFTKKCVTDATTGAAK